MLRHVRAGVLCRKGTKQRIVIPAPVYSPGRLTGLEPWQASDWKWHRMRSAPVRVWGLLLLSWPDAEDLSMAPAALKRLCSHAGLPASEPVAEHSRSQPRVRANKQPVAPHLIPGR